ncbi:class I SAM-dependent methyltransferase [Teichococcus wenyumeiae]|uniref:class I SAM-dependent methyltransferase n=1 Tax=Teichococcus wenyumeiae TaxID=2478470 RepID=UPI001314C2CB|nr:hypothetical protein [Pseudoroseomonas wenyumeiae]
MSWDWYETNAEAVVPQYEAADPVTLHTWLQDLLPSSPAAVLDVGAGSGRDAAWLAGLGHDVVAAEPANAMRTEGMRRHPEPASAGWPMPCPSWAACCAPASASR